MNNDLKVATGNFTEQTKKYEIASYYTYGDEDLAKKMLSGEYKDLYAIKTRFSSSTLNGLIFIVYNFSMRKIFHIHGLVSNSFDIQDTNTNIGWSKFECEIDKILKKNEHDIVLVNSMKDEVEKGFTNDFTNDIIKFVKSSDEISLNHSFKKLVQDKLGYMNVKISVDYEIISSLDIELNSKNSKKINLNKLKQEEEVKKNKIEKEIESQNKSNPLAGREVKLQLQGSFILSPIKGKAISKVVNGDRVMVKMVDSNPKAISVAKAFNALTEDGGIKPIKGRVIYIEHSAADGYVVYVIVAKGIFIRIDEDEDNIKVLMDPTSNPSQNIQTKKTKKSPAIIILIVVLLALILGAILFIVFK